MIDWKLLNSKIVFDNYRKVEERQYLMPNGKEATYCINIDLPSAHVVALTEDNKVITIQQFRPGPSAVLTELPGGYIDDGETPEEAMARELREETGYAGQIEQVTKYFHDAYGSVERHCFVATNCKLVGEQQLDENEFLDVQLHDLADFIEIVKSGRMTTVGVALLGLQHLGLLR